MRISDWRSDVCSSDLPTRPARRRFPLTNPWIHPRRQGSNGRVEWQDAQRSAAGRAQGRMRAERSERALDPAPTPPSPTWPGFARSEEHTSELQSLMRISYAVFCLKKNTEQRHNNDAHSQITTSINKSS